MDVPYRGYPTVSPVGGSTPFQQVQSSAEEFGAPQARALAGLGQTLEHTSEDAMAHAIRFQEMDNEANAKDADVDLTLKLGKLQSEFLSLKGKTPYDLSSEYAKKAEELRQQIYAGMPTQQAALLFQSVAGPKVAEFINGNSRYAAQQRQVWLGQSSESRAQAAIDEGARLFNDPMATLRALSVVRGEAAAQAELNGWDDATLKDRQAQYTSAVWKAKLLRMAESDPDGALALFKEHTGDMDAQTQVEVGHTLEMDSDRALSRAYTLQQHADAQSDRIMKHAGDALAIQGYKLFSEGGLTKQWVDAAAGTGAISPPEVKGFYELLKQDPNEPTQDDPMALASLEEGLANNEDIRQSAWAFLENGSIRKQTYIDYNSKNRSNLADTQPASPFKQGRDLVKTSLDPGLISFSDPTMTAMMRGAQAQALIEYEQWARANPDKAASGAEAISEAMKTVQRYQTVNTSRISVTLGLPRFYEGARTELAQGGPAAKAALAKARDLTLDNMRSGAISKEQAEQELRKIQSWQWIADHPTPLPVGVQ